MKDPRLIELRLRAERDLALSDGAFRLLCRLVSEKYNSPVFFAEGSFPLTWKTVERLCGTKEKWSYLRIAALKARGYIASEGIKNCPPTAHFHFLLNSIQKEGIKTVQKGGINSIQKGAHHISNPFGKELLREGRNSSAPRARRNEGKELIERRRTPDEENGAKVRSLAAAMRKAAS